VALLALVACSAPATSGADSPATGPLAKAPDGRPLKLVFADEFDSLQLWDGSKGRWRPTFGDGSHRGLERRSLPTNGELQLYVDPGLTDAQGPLGLNPFTVRGGVLEIQGAPAPEALRPRLGGYRYVSGLITTQPSLKQTYGYFEMRAELPRGKGAWPAFWLLPADLSWPPEIDVMESIGDPTRVYMTTHSKAGGGAAAEKTVSEGFHTYAVSWDPKTVIWYIDGVEAAREPTPADMHKPMFLLANLAVGGGWPGAPDATTTFPVRYRIDYIRAYRFAE
jgi:beta-glucanase (GH16 family)